MAANAETNMACPTASACSSGEERSLRIAVISCWGYRDAWKPFFELLDKFWPNCPYPVDLLTDRMEVYSDTKQATVSLGKYSGKRDVIVHPGSWCEILADYAAGLGEEPCMLFQEDFLLTASVKQELIEDALDWLNFGMGMVRLYPCPGANQDGLDTNYAIIPQGLPYRISCQVSIWRPQFLYAIASRFNTPSEFEIEGTKLADELLDAVMAFKRDLQPWPLEYLCSAISRGKWNPDAKKLCEANGIQADWSMREFASA